MDVSDYSKEFILEELEEFYRKSLIANSLVEMQERINKPTNELQDFPDVFRESLSFTFDSNIGLSFLEDGERMYAALHDKDKVISTGLKSLDKYIAGGLHEKSLSLWLAEVNKGKSLIMTSLSSSLLYHNKNVLYISLEMTEEKIGERIQANLFDINVNDLKLLDKKTFMKKHEALKQLTKSNLVIVQYGAKTVNANKVRSILKDLKMKKNFVPDVIFVDYLGLMTTNNKSKDSNSYTEMKTVSEELRAVFVEENIIGVSAIQTNRSGMNNVDLDMTNIADSIGTAATADLIVAVTQTDEMKEAGRYKFSIIKNRYGLNGQYTLVGVDYPKMRVYDIEDEDDSMPNTPKQGSTSITDDAVTLALSSFKGTTKKKQLDIIGME
jgi:archaellum biogenesis ATPase FlaH